MYSIKKSLLFTLSVMSFTLMGCQKENTSPNTTSSQDPKAETALKTLSIGYQKASINVVIANENKLLEQAFPNLDIKWYEFPGGPQILEALAVGSVDIGTTGDTPPVYAQAGGKTLNYIAYETAKPNSSAILIPQNSTIKTLSDLKNKRVAVLRGSSSHYLLVRALQKANLTWSDIKPIWLSPTDARAAFQKGAIDAWAIWDPYYAAAELEDHAKVLTTGVDLSPNYTFYLGSNQILKNHPNEIKRILKQLGETDTWVWSHQPETIKLIAQSTGLSEQVSQKFLERRPNPSHVQFVTPQVIQDQQQLADTFSNLKIIPKAIDIQQAAWSPN